MTPIRVLLIASLACASTIAITGCATTRVDVDVYKGPLANHEDVQVQQLAVMANAAKPLLIYLLEYLEQRVNPSFCVDQSDPHPLAGLLGKLKDEQAQRVFDVLTLYVDLYPTALAALAREGEDCLKKYREAYRILRVPEDDEKAKNAAIADRIGISMKADLYPSKALTPALKQAYMDFLSGAHDGWREQSKIFSLGEAMPGEARIRPKNEEDKYGPIANEQFRLLAEGEMVKRHADWLFDTRASCDKDLFVHRVQEIARSFLDARTQIERILAVSLDTLSHLPEEWSGSNEDKRRAQKAIAELAASIVHPCYLYYALKNGTVTCEAGRFTEQLLSAMCLDSIERLCEPTEDSDTFAQRLALVLGDEDGTNARDLLAVHRAYIERFVPTPSLSMRTRVTGKDVLDELVASLQKEHILAIRQFGKDSAPAKRIEDAVQSAYAHRNLMDNVLSPDFRRFGITRGPLKDIERFQGELMASLLDELASQFAGGLEHGRTSHGLETLTDNYQDALSKFGRENRETQEDFRLLLDALVAFAEKVLFLANNEGILGKRSAAVGETGPACQDRSATPGYSGRNLDRYVLLLQDVGNSILVQTDELRHSATHKQTLADAKNREIRGLELAVATDAREILDTLLNESSASLMGAEGKAKALATQLEGIDKRLTELGPSIEGATTAAKGPKEAYDTAKADFKKAQDEEAVCIHAQKILLDAVFRGDVVKALPSEKKPVKDVLDIVQTALNSEAAKEPASPVSDNARDLLDALSVVKGLGEGAALKPADANSNASIYDSIGVFASGKAADLHRQMLEKQREMERLDPNCKETAGKVKTLQDEKSKIDGEKKKIEADKADAEALLKELTDAIAVFKEFQDQVLSAVGDRTSPKAVLEHLRSLAQAKAGDDKYGHALAVLKRTPAAQSPGLAGINVAAVSGDAKDSKDVLDELIATLREQHVVAISEWGKDSAKARSIAAALDAAYAHRSGMVYIRPASAYLRTSYAATMLQQKPNIGWENMLDGHAMRNLPLVGKPLENIFQWNMGSGKGKIISELDKQFWQTINSVRVSGMGNTNYVIVKDDIGNWYVKGYSADPGPVIEGAKNLAMFSLGGAMGTDLLGRMNAGGVPTAAMQAETSQAPFAKLVRKYEADYMTVTNQDLESLSGLLKPASTDEKAAYTCPLSNGIADAWQGIKAIKDDTTLSTSLVAALNTAADGQLKPAYEELNKGIANAKAVSGLATNVKQMISKGPSSSLSPLLDPIIDKVANPARINRIISIFMQQAELKADAELQKKLDALKQSIGAEEPGEKIVEALQAMRRFHNQLTAALANVNFTTNAQTELDAAKKDLTVAETKMTTAQEDQQKAETALAKAEEDQKVPPQGANRDAINKAVDEAKKDVEKAKKALDTAKTDIDARKATVTEKETALAAAKQAQAAARNTVTNVVREKLNEFLDKRLAAVKTFEKALTFVGEVNSQ
jgi:hypothetical protein